MQKQLFQVVALLLGAFFLAIPVVAQEPLAPARSWNLERAAHLLNRAGFGGSAEDITRLHAMGLPKAVSYLVDYDKIPQTVADLPPCTWPELRELRRVDSNADAQMREQFRQMLRSVNAVMIHEYRAWWLKRMAETPRPLEEKMTLFWHGHFTSGVEEVRSAQLLIEQNRLFRRYATGKFSDLLREMMRDPALLVYLNAESNRREQPNENLARELLELFTMGAGHYTEKDIKEAARALTGASVDGRTYAFRRNWHDDGPKTFLGKSGKLNAEDMVNIILEQKVTGEHVARRLLVFFMEDKPDERLVRALGWRLRSSNYNVKAVLRDLFGSEAFYSTSVMRSHIKSPVEFAVGAVRALQIPDADYWYMANATAAMGQELFQPPNVKGWDGGRTWITAATLFARQEYIDRLLAGTSKVTHDRRMITLNEFELTREELITVFRDLKLPHDLRSVQLKPVAQKQYHVRNLLSPERTWTAAQAVDQIMLSLHKQPLPEQRRRFLIDELGSETDVLDFDSRPQSIRLNELIYALLIMPEFHLS